MLLMFSLSNFGPYAEEATLDMRAVASYKEHLYNTELLHSGDRALKVSAIYGANASGKSQLILGYETFRDIVLNSFTASSQPTAKDKTSSPLSAARSSLKNNYHPFRFCEEPRDTEFDVVFETQKAVYNYGFAYNASEIVAEWLYVTSSKTRRQSKIIERSSDTGINLGASVRRECNKYVQNIPRDVLALSFFSSLTLKSVVFNETTDLIGSVLPFTGFMGGNDIDQLLSLYFDKVYTDENKGQLISYLQDIDLGITDITVERNNDSILVWSHHIGEEGKAYSIPIELESDGTRKMIALHTLITYATTREAGLMVDELDADLHPLLLRHIVNQFHTQESRGQLVFTAHDLSLLDKRYLRRDQIWFSAKDDYGRSGLRSLADFKVRNDASFEDAYLAGVFGAIPNIARAEETNGN